MGILKTILSLLITINFLILFSCSFLTPTIKDPDKGIVVIPYYASNKSRLDFYRYYKIYSSDNADVEIVIYPMRGQQFAFSRELPPGIYNFDKIKMLLDSSVASSTWHNLLDEIKGGIEVEVQPGSITIADTKLYIEQYDMQDGSHVNSNIYFQKIPEKEIELIREKFNKIHSK